MAISLEHDPAASADFQRCTKSLKDTESRMSDIAELQKSISNYRRTCDVYAAYRKAGYSHKFYDEHSQEIERHKTAKACFDAQGYGRGGKKIPRIDTLKQEYATLLEDKKKLYPQYHSAKKNMVELLNAKSNVVSLLNLSPPEKSTPETTQSTSKTSVNSYDTTR